MPQGLFEFFFSFHMYTLSDGKKTVNILNMFTFLVEISPPPHCPISNLWLLLPLPPYDCSLQFTWALTSCARLSLLSPLVGIFPTLPVLRHPGLDHKLPHVPTSLTLLLSPHKYGNPPYLTWAGTFCTVLALGVVSLSSPHWTPMHHTRMHLLWPPPHSYWPLTIPLVTRIHCPLAPPLLRHAYLAWPHQMAFILEKGRKGKRKVEEEE